MDRYRLFSSTRENEVSSILGDLSEFVIESHEFRAGTILIWSHGLNTTDGVNISSVVKNILLTNYPIAARDAGIKSLFFSAGAVGNVQLEIYFFTDSELPDVSPDDCSISE